jgi:hypothetical protein
MTYILEIPVKKWKNFRDFLASSGLRKDMVYLDNVIAKGRNNKAWD